MGSFAHWTYRRAAGLSPLALARSADPSLLPVPFFIGRNQRAPMG